MKSLLQKVIEEYTSLGIGQQIDYEKLYLYSIITHSTALEGSTVTEIENQILFDEGIGCPKPMVEQMMNLDLKAAYERGFQLSSQPVDWTVQLLCELAALVMKRTGSSYKTIGGEFSSAEGQLRLVNVSAGRGGKSYLAWQKIPQRLEEFCKHLNCEQERLAHHSTFQLYRLSFLAHYQLAEIHPWADGNGRMARLVMNMIQRHFGLVPSIVKRESRGAYIQAIASCQEQENPADFVEFMLAHHIQNLQQQIVEYRSSLER